MRITFFVPRCTLDNSHGRYVVELAKRMIRKHQVTVFSGRFSPDLRSRGVECRFMPVPTRPAMLRLAALWIPSVLAKKLRQSDIVHIQGADAPVGNVVTAHCCNSAMRVAAGRAARLHRRVNYAIGASVERYCMSKTSTRRIIAVSEKVKGEIQREYLIDAKRLVVIHHGVDLEAFHPRNRSIMRASVRSQLGLAEDDFVVLFVGGEYRLKGLKTLLEAAKGLSPRLRILAIGVNTGPALNQLVGDTGLSNRVTFVQHTDQMASLHSAADCFALPTLYDTFSLATLEAMASGLPVIVSRAAGVSEILHPGHDCLILDDPEDVDVLAHHLVQVLDNEAVRNRLGDQSRKTAERHSWDGVVDRTLEVYRTVVSGSL